MAQKVVRELVDDLAAVRFGYDGHDYEIELNEAHAAEHGEEGGLDLTGDSPAHGL